LQQSKVINNLSGPKIGDMYHKCILRTVNTSTKNGLGHRATGTNTDVNVYAALQEKNLPETDQMGKQVFVQHFIFTIRYRTVSTSQQIVYKNNVYDIISVDNTTYGRNRFTILKTKRVI
jgi:head-tail adaptor